MSSDSNLKGILIAAGSGLAVGAILGVLFAPDKGSKTRQKIADKASDLKDQFVDKKDDLADMVVKLKSKIQDAVQTDEGESSDDLMKKIEELEKLIKA